MNNDYDDDDDETFSKLEKPLRDNAEQPSGRGLC